ncbi:glycoside hydrolase family 130 protein [Novosphingobium sp. G106]|uniref:glycoside hydrolase family 130 protein n=1 Tax=Novosphingobium sp. G106 TaxID=2849500 RepID=UPI001C2CEE6E|nr:glycoside hydrolase family 130 protein [Novosphingobium sp. G106]MBV1686686.1 glycoside hydrolase family 130 protein [Novosphingobium sp. G106]
MDAADVFTKLECELHPDPSRTVIRPFHFAYPQAFAGTRTSRLQMVVRRILDLESDVRERMLAFIRGPMRQRHRQAEEIFLRQVDGSKDELGDISGLSEDERLLLGAYLSEEYAFEAAALFNPSIVRIPGSEVENDGRARFILSLRGIGEGHVSSVTFRTGTWDGDLALTIDEPSPNCVPPVIEGEDEGWVRLQCDNSQDVSETVVFPVLPSQRQGVEDLRMVSFREDGGREQVMGTYTAFDGRNVRQEILRGIDLRTFEMRPLSGAMAGYKGMALFPRRIDGRYAMLGRQDGENICLLRSDDLFTWESGEQIVAPCYPWEFVQIGNCGSPIEIAEGWLVFTHGVGLMRGYSIGACLLDKADPSRVLARTSAPIVFPSAEQRGGYVPNVTYSCGALLHDRRILLPYGVADEFTAFAVANVDDLLEVMVPQ